MSDKKNINIQDRGWNDMRLILDEELPVKEKKRRFGFWFLLGAAAIGITFVTILLFESDLSTQPQVAGLEGLESLNLENKSKDQGDVIEDAEAESISMDASKNSRINDVSELKSDNITNDKIVKNVKESTNTKFLKDEEHQIVSSKELQTTSSPILKKADRNRILLAQSLLNQKNKIDSKSQKTTQKEVKQNPAIEPIDKHIADRDNNRLELKDLIKSVDSERVQLQKMNILPTIKSYANRATKRDFEFENQITVSGNKNFISPYLFASGSYQSNINGVGYGIGAGVGYGNKDVQLYLETGYIRSKFDSGSLSTDFVSSDGVSVVEVKEDNGVISNNSLDTYELSVSNFSELISSTNEVRIDLGIRKSIYSKFSLDLGLSYSKLLNASNKTLEIDFESATLTPETFANRGNISSSELYNTGAYSSYDIIPHIGIEYSVLSNLKFGVNYNRGLINLISNTNLEKINSVSSNDAIYRRNISAKLRFEF